VSGLRPGSRPGGGSGRLRIIAGSKKGHVIHAPKGLTTRPTSDRVREAAFNLIGPLGEAHVLDLFAGSGAMGLEAMSRGALRCTFVEQDDAACRAIIGNAEKLSLTGVVVIRRDVRHALADEVAAGRRYDLVLVDPPYETYPVHEAVLDSHLPLLLAPGGLAVVETSERIQPSLPSLHERTSRRYGAARLTLFEPA
jgi:16S rRNA (guanine966-N2)-methyltransferase